MIPALLLLAVIPFMPRSPRWLASKDRWNESLFVLAALRANGNQQDAAVLEELERIRERVL